jgi:sugar phosphate isomerase/epimerase
MFLGYHAYGLIDHYLPEAFRMLADVGFSGVVLPLGGRLNPLTMSPALCAQIIADVEQAYQATDLHVVIDATYPITISHSQTRGLDLLCTTDDHWHVTRETIEWSLSLAKRLGGCPLLIRSGPTNLPSERALDLLAARLQGLLPKLEELDVDVALQPAEEHFIYNVSGFQRLLQWFDSPRLRLAVDTATMFRQIEFPLYSVLAPVRERLSCVTFRDPAVRLPAGDWIGQGSVSAEAVVECLKELEYDGGLFVHSWPVDHQALSTACSVYKKLHKCL